MEEIVSKMRPCYVMPANGLGGAGSVEVSVFLIWGTPQTVNVVRADNPLFAGAIQRAVMNPRCAPWPVPGHFETLTLSFKAADF
jgi:hypothetical protein